MRIHERGQRRPQRERGVWQHLRGLQDQSGRATLCGKRVVGGGEHRAVATKLRRDHHHGHQHHDVDHGVFDESDQRRRAQTGAIGVQRKNDEGGNDRQFAGQTHRLDHHAHADQLQGNIGHGRYHAGDGDRKFEAARIVDAVNHVGRRDIAIGMRRLPQHRHHREHEGIDDDGIGQREESVGADRIDQRRHRDHRVSRIKIAADQKPGDPSAELPPAQSPFVKMRADRTGFPARGEKAHHGDKGKEEEKDRESNPVDSIGHDTAFLEFALRSYGDSSGVRLR
jgi:hypothetical protein